MIARCENPSDHNYPGYGGRGIAVCADWRDPSVFIAWIEANLGPRPDGMSLDRWPDNDGDYEPGNVRWATAAQQRANQGPRRRLSAAKRWQALKDWLSELPDSDAILAKMRELEVASDASGYFGQSTVGEIAYAVAHGKPVWFAEDAAHERAQEAGLLP